MIAIALPSRRIGVNTRLCLILIGLMALLPAPVVFSQDDKWDPDVPENLFKDEDTKDKKPKKIHRLAPAPPECPQCKGAVEALQAALDDWYAMQLAEAKKIPIDHSDTSAAGSEKQQAKNKLIEGAMAGMGQPDAKDLKKKQEQQKKNAKEKKDTHGDEKALQKEIKRLTDALKQCLEDCSNPKEGMSTPTPTPQSGTGGGGGNTAVPPPPAFDIVVPPLPPCFNSPRERDAHRKKIADLQERVTKLRKANDVLLADPPNQAWREYKQKLQEAGEAIQKQNFPGDDGVDAIDKVKIPCAKGKGPPGKKGKTATGLGHGGTPKEVREEFCQLIEDGKIEVDFISTGETCGHVADCKITNPTDGPVNCIIPSMLVESKSGDAQNYQICEGKEVVSVSPHSTVKVPVRGVCLVRNKPPVGKDVGGDLRINHCDDDAKIPAGDADRLIDIANDIFDIVDELFEDGGLKDIPYKDPEKKKNVVVQWATWSDPRISEITGVPPATKEDLKKVVKKQVSGPMTPEKEAKIDEGINDIFEAVELTTGKAKDLDKKTEEEQPVGGNTVNISNDTPAPNPETTERPEKKDKKDKKDKGDKNEYLNQYDWWKRFIKMWPKPFSKWMAKKLQADWADQWKQTQTNEYNRKFQDYCNQNKHYQDVKNARDTAEQKAKAPGATQADKDAFDKADGELKKLQNDMKPDFNKTDAGKSAFDNMHRAENKADEAHAAEQEAGKNIDPATKEAAEGYFKDNPPPPTLLHPDDPVKAMW